MRATVYAGVVVIALSLILVVPGSAADGVLAGLATGFAVPLVDQMTLNRRWLRFGIEVLLHWRSEIRISASYLYQIEDRGRYLLIRGGRFRHQLQPVGGVYKAMDNARAKFNEWGARTDELIRIDDVSERDIRIRLPTRKLFSFMRWFEKGTMRESSPWREFYEELVKPGILPAAAFPYIYHDFVRRRIWIRYSHRAGCREILIADVVRLLPNEAQQAALRDTQTKAATGVEPADTILWATADQIRRRGAVPGVDITYEIADHSVWIL